MIGEFLSFSILLIVLLPFYIQFSIYSLAFRVLKHDVPQDEAFVFAERQIPVVRWLCKSVLKRIYERKDQEDHPTVRGIMVQRVLGAIIPVAFVVATAIGLVEILIDGSINRTILYIIYEAVFLVALYISWNFGASLKSDA